MATIRDLVGALRQREGVDAAVVLGRDGLLIDSETSGSVNAESVAALVPSIIAAAEEFGAHDSRGALATAILEYEQGIAVDRVALHRRAPARARQPIANIGQLLFELRRNRENMSSLV